MKISDMTYIDERNKYLKILFGDPILFNRYSNELKTVLFTGKLSDDNIYKILLQKMLMPYSKRSKYGLITRDFKSIYKITF